MTRSRRATALLLGLVATVLVSTAAVAPQRADADDVTAPTTVVGVVGPHVHPDLDPGTIGLCNTGFGSVSVAHITAAGLGGVDLRCGDSASGYVHIRSHWESAWRNAVAGAPGQHNWDDFAVFAIKRALEHPYRGYPHRSSQTWCYTATIRVTTASGHVIRTLNPSVIVSPKTRNVLTAVPTSRPDCSAQ